jgi:hypothetical protein
MAPIAQFWALSSAGLILQEGQPTEDPVGYGEFRLWGVKNRTNDKLYFAG